MNGHNEYHIMDENIGGHDEDDEMLDEEEIK